MGLNFFSALLVIILVISASFINVFKIKNRQVDPTLSTWLIILIASLLSFSSYLIAQDREVVAGALNLADVISTGTITVGIIVYGRLHWHLRSFEKFYLIVLAAVCVFWLFTSDPFVSNLLLQATISLGYLPTMHTIIKTRSNTESFVVWGLILAASVISLYPAITALSSGNVLSLVYTLRSIALLSLTLLLMAIFNRKTIPPRN